MLENIKGLFGGTEKGEDIVILSPVSGEMKPIETVSDPAFSDEILGLSVAVFPDGGKVYAPVNGTVFRMFDTGHAVGILSEDGVEVLIHIGINTVNLKGEHFTTHVHTDDEIKAGDLLIEFDRDALIEKGYDVVTPVIICNPKQFKEVVKKEDVPNVTTNDVVFTLRK